MYISMNDNMQNRLNVLQGSIERSDTVNLLEMLTMLLKALENDAGLCGDCKAKMSGHLSRMFQLIESRK